MFIEANKPLNSSLPFQQVPLSEKLKDMDEFGVSEWMKQNMDGLEAIGRMQFWGNVALKENYEIINGRFILQHYLDSNDYYDITSAISQEFELPNYLHHYDITTKAVYLLLGEYLKRPDILKIVDQNPDATNEKIRLKTELLQSYMQSQITNEITRKLQLQGIDPNKQDFQDEEEMQQYQQMIQQKYQEMTPAAIEKYMKYDYRSSAEHWGQAVISTDKRRFNLREQDKTKFTDMLVADRCFSHFYLTPTGYSMEPWNPLNTFFHQSPEVKNVEDGNWVGRTFYMSKAQVLDRYGWRMTEDQQKALYPNWDKSGLHQGTGINSVFQTWMYPFQDYDYFKEVDKAFGASIGFNPLDRTSLSSIPLASQLDMGYGAGNPYGFMQNDLIQVTEAYWRSQRRLGYLVLLNPDTGELEEHIVDETFDPKLFGVKERQSTYRDSKEEMEPNTITWVWVNQIWQGVKINENHLNSTVDTNKNHRGLYVDIRPVDFQFKGDYNIFNPKLPVCGGVFNNRNGRSMSIVDLLKPYQIFYNALMNQCYGICQRNNGKIFLMDINLLPNLKDWGGGDNAIEKFKSMADALGLGIVDTSPSNINREGAPNFNNFGVYDLSEHDKVTALMNLAMMVEQQGYIQLGITPQREGQILASETATNANAAREISYAITETYFENYYNFKIREMKMHLDIAQFAASKDKDIVLSYTTSDLGNAFIKTTSTEIMLADLGVYPENSAESQRQKQIAEQLILNNNTTNIPLSKLIGMLRYDSIIDMQKALEQSEEEFYKQQMQQQQHEKEMQDAALQAAAQEKQEERLFQAQQNEADRQNKLQVETLKGIANESSFNPDVDLTDKLIAQRDISIKESQLAHSQMIEQQRLLTERVNEINKQKVEKEKLAHEKKIKSQEAASKKEIENKKLEQIQVQNKNQEKLAKMKHDSDIAIKNKELELKKLDKEMKEMDIQNAKKKSAIEINHLKEKTNVEKKLADVKAESIRKLTEVKQQEAKKLSEHKVDEAKATSKINIDTKKKMAKIKVKKANKPDKS